MKKIFLAIVCFAGLMSCKKQNFVSQRISGASNDDAIAKTVFFSGYTWNVKNGSHLGPGPNYWRQNNVWVDANGFLHLKITKDETTGKWYCAEVSTQQTFGYGTWQFWVEGRIDKMDKNVVLGLFNYSGNDGFDEMDIEWARWGNKHYPNCNYTVWPAEKGFKNFSYVKDITLSGKNTTQRFIRTESSVSFQSLQGFTNGNNNEFASATCTQPPKSVSKLSMPAYINLWLMKGLPPANGKEIELVIHKFTYKSPS